MLVLSRYLHLAVNVPQLVFVIVYDINSNLVSCPAHAHLPARNSLVNEVEFLGLITQNR